MDFVATRRPIWFMVVGTVLCFGPWVLSGRAHGGEEIGQKQIRASARAALHLAVDLASDCAPADTEQCEQAFNQLFEEARAAYNERVLIDYLFASRPGTRIDALVAAPGNRSIDYLWAAYESFGRFQAAEKAGDHDAMARHLTASRKYAALAARGIRGQAEIDTARAKELQGKSFATRRPAARAGAFLEDLGRNGVSDRHRSLFIEAGYGAEKLDAFVKELVKTPGDRIGISMVEMYQDIANHRFGMADWLEAFAQKGPERGSQGNTFTVGNPRDKEMTIDLFIRGVALPPSWKLSIVDAAEPVKEPTGKPANRVLEVVPGKHYRVTLPAKGEIRVASVVQPVGEAGENTTARWAVEGKIGDEVIGGMVHELHVPGYLPDLELPSVRPAAARTSQPAVPAKARSWGALLSLAAAGGLVILAAVVVLLRRRQPRT